MSNSRKASADNIFQSGRVTVTKSLPDAGPDPEFFLLGALFFEMVISSCRHRGCLRVKKLRVFKTSDPLKTYSVGLELDFLASQFYYFTKEGFFGSLVS